MLIMRLGCKGEPDSGGWWIDGSSTFSAIVAVCIDVGVVGMCVHGSSGMVRTNIWNGKNEYLFVSSL